jgi:hypothetical protein
MACYEPVEGCLDADAKNYNVAADNDCSGCCQLPQVDIVITFLFNDNSFNLGDTLDVGASKIILSDFHIYLSNITVQNNLGESLYLEDSVRIENSDGSQFFVGDNYRYFDRQRFSTSLDGLRYTGPISSISFDVGIPETYNLYNNDSLRINSGLSTIPSDAYQNGNGFIFFSFDLSFIEGENQKLELLNTFPLSPVVVNLSGTNAELAEDLNLSLVYDLGIVLDGISKDFSELNNLEIVRDNIANAFSQKP